MSSSTPPRDQQDPGASSDAAEAQPHPARSGGGDYSVIRLPRDEPSTSDAVGSKGGVPSGERLPTIMVDPTFTRPPLAGILDDPDLDPHLGSDAALPLMWRGGPKVGEGKIDHDDGTATLGLLDAGDGLRIAIDPDLADRLEGTQPDEQDAQDSSHEEGFWTNRNERTAAMDAVDDEPTWGQALRHDALLAGIFLLNWVILWPYRNLIRPLGLFIWHGVPRIGRWISSWGRPSLAFLSRNRATIGFLALIFFTTTFAVIGFVKYGRPQRTQVAAPKQIEEKDPPPVLAESPTEEFPPKPPSPVEIVPSPATVPAPLPVRSDGRSYPSDPPTRRLKARTALRPNFSAFCQAERKAGRGSNPRCKR